ncbi:MAG: hypothetical protein ACP5HS_09290 [Anaerolineae bacterium]
MGIPRIWSKLLLTLLLTLTFANGAMVVPRTLAQEADHLVPAKTLGEFGTDFTYQGSLADGGGPANGIYDFEFKLYNDATDGALVANSAVLDNVGVSDGIFTVSLDFVEDPEEDIIFDGTPLWLEISVRAGGSTGTYTTLSPRQALTATPYAHSLRPGAHIVGEVGNAVLYVENESTSNYSQGLVGHASGPSGLTSGVYGVSDSSNGRGVHGFVGSTTGSNYGVYGESRGTTGRGVYGYAGAVTGETYGVYGRNISSSGGGVYGEASAASGMTAGVYGTSKSTMGTGVYGYARSTTGSNCGVYGESQSETGVGVAGYASALTDYAFGVLGVSDSDSGAGLYGWSTATSGNTAGVYAECTSPEGAAVLAHAVKGHAGYFGGPVIIAGTLTKAAGSFKIDHPLDPEGRYLYHSFVESPDMKNIYDGVVTLDGEGTATVQLPEWFEALNRDYRYQLTPVGAPMPDLHIAQEVQDNVFKIAGGEPGQKVSWQVTGIRHDPYAEQNRIPVEEEKPASEQGTYLYPEGYDQPEGMGLTHALVHAMQER